MNRDYIEKEGATPREAFLKALLEMGALEEEVEHTIEEVLYKGFFGTTKKAYRCRLWLKTNQSPDKSSTTKPLPSETGKQETPKPKPTPGKTMPTKAKPGQKSETQPTIKTSNQRQTLTQTNITKELLDRLGLEYENIREYSSADGWNIEITCDDPSRLIGKDGHTLFALQRILSTLFFRQYGKGSVSLDINGYLRKREKRIEEQAFIAITKVKQQKKKVELKPMNSWERKIVHRKANEAGVKSLSYGTEPYRRVVLSLENGVKSK